MKDFQITMYRIMHKKDGKLLGFCTESNSDGEFCCPVGFKLENWSDRIWLVDSFEKAEKVRKADTDWFNAEYETPENSYKPKELKTVRIEINVTNCE